MSEFKVKGEKVYLSSLIDLFNQEVITYKTTKTAQLPLVTDMFKQGLARLSKKTGGIVHSDQGQTKRPDSDRISKPGLS